MEILLACAVVDILESQKVWLIMSDTNDDELHFTWFNMFRMDKIAGEKKSGGGRGGGLQLPYLWDTISLYSIALRLKDDNDSNNHQRNMA